MGTLIKSFVVPQRDTSFALMEHKLSVDILKEKIFSLFNTVSNDLCTADPALGLGIDKNTRVVPAFKGNYIFTNLEIMVCMRSSTMTPEEFDNFYRYFSKKVRKLIKFNRTAKCVSVEISSRI